MNHMAPSGPAVMPYVPRIFTGSANVVIAPFRVSRPIAFPPVVNQIAPSAPEVIATGEPMLEPTVVTTPAMLIRRAIRAPLANQSAPSGPTVIASRSPDLGIRVLGQDDPAA